MSSDDFMSVLLENKDFWLVTTHCVPVLSIVMVSSYQCQAIKEACYQLSILSDEI